MASSTMRCGNCRKFRFQGVSARCCGGGGECCGQYEDFSTWLQKEIHLVERHLHLSTVGAGVLASVLLTGFLWAVIAT